MRSALPADAIPTPALGSGALAGLTCGLMLASGFAGLGYQIVWTQQAALSLGHEAAAVLAVITAFFGGLALGAWVLGPRIEQSLRPAQAYALCELAIAVWSGVLTLVLAPASSWVLDLTGAQPEPLWQWALAFGATFLLLLPATASMGATLPAMARLQSHLQSSLQSRPQSDLQSDLQARQRPRQQAPVQDQPTPTAALPALYACNTGGAMLGVLATAFWLVPAYGLARTVAICAGLNLLCALAALRLGARAADPAPAPSASAPRTSPGSLVFVLVSTGLLGIAYEVLVVRVLSQVTEATVYTFASLLAVYLAGTAAGAAAWQRWRPPAHGRRARPSLTAPEDARPAALRAGLLCALAAACLLGSATLWGAETLRDGVQQVLGNSLAAALLAEATLALAAFALPTAVMGALFSELALQAQDRGLGFSRALALNTLGAAAAPALFGVLLVPALGPKGSLLLVVAGYLLLAAPRGWLTPKVWCTALAAGAAALWAPPLAFVDVPEGGRIVSYREGALAAVSVVEDAAGVSRLRINNRQQEGSSHTRLSDARQALLPLLLHPAPQRVLLLGLGTGTTARAAAAEAGLQVDAVDLLPEVIAAASHFAIIQGASETAAAASNLRLLAADARRTVRNAGPAYDVIVSDNFHPARSGSGSLYTVEHFQAVKQRLGPDGVFCQWLPLHQLDLETLRSVVRAHQQVYPGGWALLATNSLDTPVLGLVATRDGARLDAARLQQRWAAQRMPLDLANVGLGDLYALLGGFIAGPQALARLAGDAPLNTDDHPVVAYRAPRITYVPDSAPRDRLLALLQAVQITPRELLADSADGELPARLAAYWAARDRFIAAGRNVRPSADVAGMLAQVREPLLAVLRTSPDFSPAREPLLRMAQALAARDPQAAQALVEELARLAPAAPR